MTTTPEGSRRTLARGALVFRWAARWLLIAAFIALMPSAASAAPTCPALSASQAAARVDLVFEGVALPGPASANGILSTPARFSVSRYIKGTGAGIVSVAGGPRTASGGLISLTSAGVFAKAGQSWVVYANGQGDGIVETSSCDGTHLAGGATQFISESPSPSPTPPISGSLPAVEAPVLIAPGWAVPAAAGIGGLGLVMGIGWFVARKVVGT